MRTEPCTVCGKQSEYDSLSGCTADCCRAFEKLINLSNTYRLQSIDLRFGSGLVVVAVGNYEVSTKMIVEEVIQDDYIVKSLVVMIDKLQRMVFSDLRDGKLTGPIEDIAKNHQGLDHVARSQEYHLKMKAAEEYFRKLREPGVTKEELKALEAEYLKRLEPFGEDPAFFAALRIERESDAGVDQR